MTMTRPEGVLLLLGCVSMFVLGCEAGSPEVALRAENIIVMPSTGPVTHVLVHNRGAATYKGTLVAKFPDAWRMNKTSQAVTVAPGRTVRVPFAIEKGTDSPDNSYPVRLQAVAAQQKITRSQTIVCASAPYFKPTIDGKTSDWADAIPVRFTTRGKKTTISTYWNRRSFCLLVAVEEDALKGLPAAAPDAVQLAISPRKARTPAGPGGKLQRYEFLLAVAKAGAKCFALAKPGMDAGIVQSARPLAGLELPGAKLAVARRGRVSYYECAIPFKAIPRIRPDPGREFRFSLLVHDPGGTGLRDWGAAAGLWQWQRSRLAWCSWAGANWPDEPPFDNKIEWGLCSSKH